MNQLAVAARTAAWPLALVVLVSALLPAQAPPGKPMSFHNRLLLNRLTVSGHERLEVMLLAKVDELERVLMHLQRLDGHATRAERSIGYVRATAPLRTFVELVASSSIEAYQISSLSKGGWYRDGPPRENAEMFRRYEISPLVRPPSSTPGLDLPPMTPDAANRISRAADADVGIDEWLAAHPTYDGRGVTIALMESAQLEFRHPAFQTANTLDGIDVPKFAGILNTIDLDEPDETRIELATEIVAVGTWHPIGARTYILPDAGAYHLGVFRLPMGGNLIQEFGVLRDDTTGEIRVDTDGDADLREEAPIAPSSVMVHTQHLHISSPRTVEIAFAVTEGRSPAHLHLYLAKDGHQTMTASVAAGNRSAASLAYGVAPGARVLLVRNTAANLSLRATLESYLDAMRRPDVDIVCDSTGFAMVPDTSADFAGLFLARLIAAYRKPIIHSAGNAGSRLGSVSALGEVLTVGGASEPFSFAALYGRGELAGTIVDPRSSAGPALDGMLKPDFIAPMSRLAAGAFLDEGTLALPTFIPETYVPAGYRVSCCTSASSPYAAGVAALLLSAAKQAKVPYSVESLGRALRAGARFLDGWPSYEQGSGLLQVRSAWVELQRIHTVPAIEVTGPNAHVLSSYSANGSRGPGLFEREGWRAGMKGQRVLEFRRTSGAPAPLTYRLSWTGNDGTFNAPSTITLPLGQEIPLFVFIAPRSPGAHGAILNLHDEDSNAIIFSTQATVVAAEQFAAGGDRIHLTGTVPLMRSATHYVSVPTDVDALRLELEVQRGGLKVSVVSSHGLSKNYYWHVEPAFTRTLTPGKYSLLLPAPNTGTWGITLTNTSAVYEADRANVSLAEAVYDLSAQLLKASVAANLIAPQTVAVDVTNLGATILEPAIDVSIGTLRVHRGTLLATALPNRIAIDVPADTDTLMLKLRAAENAASSLDLFLYDCTSGECFSYDFTLPAGPTDTFVVREPRAGRWVAAINSAPVPSRVGEFTLQEIITSNTTRHRSARAIGRPRGARWTEVLALRFESSAPSEPTPVILFELIDAAAERDALSNPWENRPGLPNLAERVVAVGTAVLPLR